MDLEKLILKTLVANEQYARKVSPHLKKDYFSSVATQIIFLISHTYFNKYNRCATNDILRIELDRAPNLNEQSYKESSLLIEELGKIEPAADEQWILDNTEKYCQDKAIELALMEAISILKGEDPKNTKDAIPEILKEALL